MVVRSPIPRAQWARSNAALPNLEGQRLWLYRLELACLPREELKQRVSPTCLTRGDFVRGSVFADRYSCHGREQSRGSYHSLRQSMRSSVLKRVHLRVPLYSPLRAGTMQPYNAVHAGTGTCDSCDQ